MTYTRRAIFDSLLSGNATSIDTGASAIPPGYRALEIHLFGRTDEATVSSGTLLVFNNNTTDTYARQYSGANNTTFAGNTSSGTTGINIPFPGTTNTASVFGVWDLVFPCYDQTAAYKAGSARGGWYDTTASRAQTYVMAVTLRNTTAITRVEWKAGTATNLVTGSRMTIYGV